MQIRQIQRHNRGQQQQELEAARREHRYGRETSDSQRKVPPDRGADGPDEARDGFGEAAVPVEHRQDQTGGADGEGAVAAGAQRPRTKPEEERGDPGAAAGERQGHAGTDPAVREEVRRIREDHSQEQQDVREVQGGNDLDDQQDGGNGAGCEELEAGVAETR